MDDSDPNSIQSLQNLIVRLENAFQSKSGGDCPEFCYDGIIEALNTEDNYGYPVMVQGSQLMVITDAPSKGIKRAFDVIHQASNAEVCIHFFLGENSYNCFEDSPGSIEEYETIASTTGGVVVNSKFDFSTFVQRYRNEPCGFLSLNKRRKRNAEGVCHSFNVASLICLVSLSIKTTEEAVTLTRPDNERIIINATQYKRSTEHIALFSESHPPSGKWKVCGENPIEVSVDFKMCIDIAPFFIAHTIESESFLTAETSPGCK